MNRKEYEKQMLGITYQMSLDAFLKEATASFPTMNGAYEQALHTLTQVKTCRSRTRKMHIAKQALMECSDCIEAYLVLGMYQENIFETLRIYKEGMEKATMNLGNTFFQQMKTHFYEEKTEVFFQMKFAYASALYDAGFMRKAYVQFEEILSLHPRDVFCVRNYLYCLYLLFEEYEKFKELCDRYPLEDTFSYYAMFLYFYKRQYVVEAKKMLPKLYKRNSFLYEWMVDQHRDIALFHKDYEVGSEEEASYCRTIFESVLHHLHYLSAFMKF